MPYLSINDFKYGLDRRRERVAGIPGTLWTAENVIISRGGDVQRMKRFVPRYTLPTGTFGLYGASSQLTVFGSAPAPTMPTGVIYVRLTAADPAANMVRVLDAKAFDGKPYVIAEFDDGNIHHYYDGVRLTVWDRLSDENSSLADTADYLADKLRAEQALDVEVTGTDIFLTARVPGEAFAVAGAVQDNVRSTLPTAVVATTTANVAGVVEVRATGTFTINGASGSDKVTDVRVNGVSLLDNEIVWATSNSATATAIAAAITADLVGGYSATAVGATVTLTAAAGTGATPNGHVVTVKVAGSMTATKTNMTGGVTGVTAVKQVSTLTIGAATFDPGDIFTAVVGGTAYARSGLSSLAATATALASDIDARTDVVASAAGNVVTVTAATAGTGFTMTASTTDATVSAPTLTITELAPNVVAVAEARSAGTITVVSGTLDTGVNTVSQITVGATALLAAPVNYGGSAAATANAIVVAITNNSTSGFSASAVGNVVTILGPYGTDGALNGTSVVVDVTGDVITSSTPMAGGVAAVDAQAQVVQVSLGAAVFDPVDQYRVEVYSGGANQYVVTGRAAGAGTSIFIQKKRCWSTANRVIRYSALNSATDWSSTAVTSIGAGLISPTTDSDGSKRLVGIVGYNGQAAIFARDNVRIYQFATDADQIEYVQTLDNTGSRGARGLVPYGNTDVYYLDETGIRSIRSRDGYNSAFVSDVGSAIDPFVQQVCRDAGPTAVERAVGVSEPADGRYWLAIGSKILVLSYFPGSQITAWACANLDYEVSDILRRGSDVFVRAGDTIYLYGGLDRNTYPLANEQIAVVETAFMAANDPAGVKTLKGFDIGCSGEWLCEILVDPSDASRVVSVGRVTKTTYHSAGGLKLPGVTTHVAFRFTCSRAGAATISSMAIHYDKAGSG